MSQLLPVVKQTNKKSWLWERMEHLNSCIFNHAVEGVREKPNPKGNFMFIVLTLQSIRDTDMDN
ncbi:hypothetical protein CHH60_13060 [Paenibacillus sp. 7523-1]|nr:hypothetical protein CHH60_13060 [Paenibacillus sp. 7523-1]